MPNQVDLKLLSPRDMGRLNRAGYNDFTNMYRLPDTVYVFPSQVRRYHLYEYWRIKSLDKSSPEDRIYNTLYSYKSIPIIEREALLFGRWYVEQDLSKQDIEFLNKVCERGNIQRPNEFIDSLRFLATTATMRDKRMIYMEGDQVYFVNTHNGDIVGFSYFHKEYDPSNHMFEPVEDPET